jgi:hypothetical protein
MDIVRRTSYFDTVVIELWYKAVREGKTMTETDTQRDDRDEANDAPEQQRDSVQAQRRELRAAAAAEASYILSMRGR